MMVAVVVTSASSMKLPHAVRPSHLQVPHDTGHATAAGTHAAADRAAQTDLAKVFRQTFMVTTLNPKGIAFFLAFIPQFVAADRPYWGQVTVYGLLFVGLGGLNALAYAYLSGRLAFVFDRPGPVRILRRVSAGFLLFAALITAAGHVPTL